MIDADAFKPMRLAMRFAGAEWIQGNLNASAKMEAQRKTPPKKRTNTEMSPLGITVADLLGYVFAGIYHMDTSMLIRVDWSNRDVIEVNHYGGLATWDFNELTKLVVVAHDMMLRMEVRQSGPRRVGMAFWQRRTREGGIAERMPTIEQQIEAIRKGYTVEPQP